jgi:uncharacterized protein
MSERRILGFELRAINDSKPMIQGYAAKYGTLSQNLGGFRETIQRGAFDKVSVNGDVRCLFNHNPDHVLGRQSAGTLVLAPDQTGLYFSCMLPGTQFARDLHASIKRGDIKQCSFGFTVAPGGQTWSTTTDADSGEEVALRTITKLSLLTDVSPVTYPAYEDTQVVARALPPDVPAEFRSRIEEFRSHHRNMSRELLDLALS